MKLNILSLVQIIVAITLLISCQKEEYPSFSSEPCEPEHYHKMIDTWGDPKYICVNEQHPGDCLDTVCIDFKLQLNEDSTYQLYYLLLNANSNPPEIVELQDNGKYVFECLEQGYFTMKFSFSFIEGQLRLMSNHLPTRNLNVRWDGFMGYQIEPKELGVDFACKIHLSPQ